MNKKGGRKRGGMKRKIRLRRKGKYTMKKKRRERVKKIRGNPEED